MNAKKIFILMEIPELKARLSILEVAANLGIEVDRHGKALCPFHDDKIPSLQLSREKNIATCFSANCDAGTMDIISLTEKYLKLSTHEAIMQLKKWAGEPAATIIGSAHTSGNGKPGTRPVQKESGTLERIAILTKAFRYYENGMRTSARAREYLTSRGLTQSSPNKQGIETGYNSGNFHNRANKNLIDTALKYGLIYERGNKDGYTAFAKDSLAFPLKNNQGKITGLYFRALTDKAINRHFYLKDRQGLYPRYPRPETRKLILTEAIIDAATLLQIPGITGQYEVLACYGTNGLTAEHVQAIGELKQLSEIIFFFDGDQAGEEGIQRIAEILTGQLSKAGISYVETPQDEDVNSLYVAHTEKAEEMFAHLINTRKPINPESNFFSSAEKEKLLQPVQKEPVTSKPVTRSGRTPLKADKFDASNPYKIEYYTDTAHYQVKGGLRHELDSLRISLVIEATGQREGYQKYRNKVDLYENKQVERMAREAAEKLNLREDLVELDLHRLTDHLEEYRDSKMIEQGPVSQKVIPDSTTSGRCKAFLSKPDLIGRLNELIGRSGVVGEENNRIFLFCIAASSRMPDTLHALIQGSSASGKTHLLTRISSLIPQEDVKRFTRVTESSFYNYGMYELQNKLICLEDLDGMKEEAQLAFRELQSREMLSSSTTGQDEKGNIRAYEKVVYGPIASLACTTKGEIYEDNMSRCFLIAVDETISQTQRIIAYQNRKAAGLIDGREQEQTCEFIRNCIRMLKPYEVINPYADKVQLPEQAHKIRRLNDLYQSFVRQITLMNQYRRKTDDQRRLITEKEDLQVAAGIMFDSIILKVDELDGSLRLFYERLKDYIRGKGEHYSSYSFGLREIRQALHVSKTGLHRYIHDLLELEYIQQTGGYANRGYQYKVTWWDNIGALRAKVKRHLQGQLDQLEIL